MFEPHIIAIDRTLRREGHPVFDFLKPLTKDTLFLNCKQTDPSMESC